LVGVPAQRHRVADFAVDHGQTVTESNPATVEGSEGIANGEFRVQASGGDAEKRGARQVIQAAMSAGSRGVLADDQRLLQCHRKMLLFHHASPVAVVASVTCASPSPRLRWAPSAS